METNGSGQQQRLQQQRQYGNRPALKSVLQRASIHAAKTGACIPAGARYVTFSAAAGIALAIVDVAKNIIRCRIEGRIEIPDWLARPAFSNAPSAA